jgi:predicted O-linked N-acetylglucosamine transferase (SPINDLY family)
MESELDAILTSPVPRLIDNVPPINYGFSTGFFFGFHGFNNRGLKSRLHRLYLIYCPALKNGYFLDSSLSSFNSPLGGRGTDGQIREEAEIGEEAGAVWLYRKNHLSSSAATVTASSTGSADMKKQYQQPPKKGDAPRTKATTGAAVLGSGKEVQSPSGSRVLRIGIASRYIYTHAVGFIVEGVVRELSSAGYIVEVFAIDGYLSRSTDVLVNKINKHAHVVHSVAADLSLFVETIRQAALDVLFYPDLGLDPIPYFAAFSRLAPIQITGLGHQDTSGISTIDYFISDELDPPGHEAFYTEKLIRMPGMGTCFYDRFISYASQLQNPRTGILERAKYIESIGTIFPPYSSLVFIVLSSPPHLPRFPDIPRASHVYIIGQPLYALHPSFDQVIIQILTSDQLGQVIFLDKHPAKDSWIQLFSLRFPETIRSRLKFHSDLAFSDYLKAIGAGHVLLDPFPVSLYESSFIALSIGIPIITMPSKSSAMNNRMTLSLLSRLGWHGDGLVVSTPAEYVELALRLTHKPKVRSKFVERIISTRHKLFDCSKVVPSWRSFFQYALERKRNDTATATWTEGAEAGGGDGGVTIILPEPRVE